MCTTCGCSAEGRVEISHNHSHDEGSNHSHHHHAHDHDHTHTHNHTHTHDHTHDHDHSHDHVHSHDHPHSPIHGHAHHHETPHSHDHHHHHHPDPVTVSLEQKILAKNNSIAKSNRSWFLEHNILTLNLVSSPGAGKTTLLERTIKDLKTKLPISVIEGDQETDNDARRIREAGCRVVQINTGAGCHLEADMLAKGLNALQPTESSVLMIENVGNLVCPALFDLGEFAKVVIFSVTEGEDKPIKYPYMFRESRLMIISKTDLLPYVDFDLTKCIEYARQVNPEIEVIQLSATKGLGLNDWYSWIHKRASELEIASDKLQNEKVLEWAEI